MSLNNETDLPRPSMQFEPLDQAVAVLEANVRDGILDLATILQNAMDLVNQILVLYGHSVGKPVVADEDVLITFKRFVKGDPSLNAVRDNIRELVYYHNCVAADCLDSLPKVPAQMAVRTVRHIYLYLRSRVEQTQ